MFQAKKWNWKRVAANLLLVPVLAGGSVAIVQAQFGKSGGSGTPAMPTTMSSGKGAAAKGASTKGAAAKGMPGATSNPKQLLKDGRKALAEGRFAAAQDLAMAAEANNPSGKWGLFDDTPAALRKDIQAALTKANKTQADQLVKQAKALANKPAANDAERAANLDGAIQMARHAEKLHGPYSMWDLSDRADKLLKDLESDRDKLKVAAKTPAPKTNGPAPKSNMPGPNPGSVAGMPGTPKPPAGRNPTLPNALPPGGSGVQQVGGAKPAPAPATDARKSAAVKLMAEAKALADQGNFAGAKAKYTEADKLGATFAPNEPSPGFALQDLNARGAGAMDRLVRDAQNFIVMKDYAKADAALATAGNIAGALGLFPRPVADAKAALHVASGGKFGTPSPSGLVAAGGPEHRVPAPPVAPAAPVGPTPVVSAPTGPTPVAPGVTPPVMAPGHATVYGDKPPAPTGGTLTGKQLLDQAHYEFKKGEFDTAERLAIQAHNQGMQQDAAQLLNSIGAEKLARKQRTAAESVANAKTAFDQKEYQRAFGVLVLVDAKLLSEEQKTARDRMLAACKAELDKAGSETGLVTAGGMEQPDPMPKSPTEEPGATNPPGTARVSDNPTATADALRSVQAQKLRAEGLKVQADALAAFGRGETDLAMQMLVEYANRVRASGLDPASVARLLRSIEGRLDNFQMMKAQADSVARQNKEKRDAKELLAHRGVAEEERKAEVAKLVRQYHDLVKNKGDYAKAERVALQAKQLDPDDPAVGALVEMAKLQRRVKEAEKDKSDKEKYILGALNDNDRVGPLVTNEDPVAVKIESFLRASKRGSGFDLHQKTRSPAEYEIEQRLDKLITVEFNQTPLDQAIDNVQTLTQLPLHIDEASLTAEGISLVHPVTVKPGTAVAAKNILAVMLEELKLSYVIEHDMVKVTTIQKAKGRMVTKVFSVADLVTPVPNFALPDYANFDKMLNKNPLNSGSLMLQGVSPGVGGATPYTPAGGLTGGVPAGSPALGQLATTPGIQTPYQGGQGGTLQSNPLAGSSNVTGANNSKHEQLIKLITSMVRPYSWDGHGGAGKVEFFDIGSALVVNQTADVISEVVDLLEALRRLQDLAVAVEVRIVSLAEAFFERMGVDFSVNIKTNTTSFEPALTTGQFRPQPFINDINQEGTTIGLTPAGTFTPDLDVPIRATSFQRGIPGFGNYPNSPGNNGGIAFGLAFLNDIQVFTFLELAQGDMRSNIMQAPKLTLFNGQTSTLSVGTTEFFVTSVQVVSVNGQIVFIPQQSPLPGPGDFNQGGLVNITIQAVVSADRRFVRLNLPVQMSVQSGATVPLFPITTFITPVFEGGSQGQPIPFTQFLQQPAFTNLSIQTTVVCPDGGTVLLGGLKTLSESRNEFGPPFLSKIPYINRLFKNVGVGRESRHVMIMVTPRIIINSEEEIFQTEGRLPGQFGQ